MTTVTVLLYGKLADIFGRKPVIIAGIIIFLIGSLLCGFAVSMEMLILFRFVQGLGAGAISPIATTIVGDIYPNEERGKIQGYLSSVWGISSILGPAIGGFMVEFFSWHFVFWLNIPLGLLSLFGFALFLHEDVDKEKKPVDYLSAILLMLSITCLMIVLVEGGADWGWFSVQSIGLLSLFFIGMYLFYIRGTHIPEPIIPVNLWEDRMILIANIVSFLTGVILIGIASYLPTYVQG